MSGGSEWRGMHVWVRVCVYKGDSGNWGLVNEWMRLGDVWNKRISSSKQKYARESCFFLQK